MSGPSAGSRESNLDMGTSQRLQEELRRRIGRLENTAWVVGALAVTFGLGGASLWNKLGDARQMATQLQTDIDSLGARVAPLDSSLAAAKNTIDKHVADAKLKVDQYVAAQQATVAEGGDAIKQRVEAAKAEVDRYGAEKRSKVFSHLTSDLFGPMQKKPLGQWLRAETSGFIIVAVGGTGGADATVRAWVNKKADENTHNRTALSGYTSDLLLVHKGDYYKASESGSGRHGTLLWVPLQTP